MATGPFPENLPSAHVARVVSPGFVTQTGEESSLGPTEMRTFRIASPLDTHWLLKTCAEVNCHDYRFGWSFTIDDPDSVLGQQQVAYINGSGLTFSLDVNQSTGAVTYNFIPGQNSWLQHWQRQDIAPNYSTFIGDYRGEGASTSLTTAEWLTMFAKWLRELHELQFSLRGVAKPLGSRNPLPRILKADQPPANYGYAFALVGLPITDAVTQIDIHLPRDTNDNTRPLRITSMMDLGFTIYGLRDVARTGIVRQLRRSVRGMAAATVVPVSLSIGLFTMVTNVAVSDASVVRVDNASPITWLIHSNATVGRLSAIGRRRSDQVGE